MKLKTFILILLLKSFFLNAQEKNVFDVARNGTVVEMRALMKQNPDVINAVGSMSFTPLILACYRGNTAVAQFLIENVKDVNYKSSEGTALAAVCMNYKREVAEALLNKGADPEIADSAGTTPLIWAVKTGNEELVKLLLYHHSKKDHADHLGLTPFEYAIQSHRENIINLLKNN